MTITVRRLIAIITGLAFVVVAAVLIVPRLDGRNQDGSPAKLVNRIEQTVKQTEQGGNEAAGASATEICTISRSGTDEAVSVLGTNANAVCRSYALGWSTTSERWLAGGPTDAASSGAETVCELVAVLQGKPEYVAVTDNGSQTFAGIEMCNDLRGNTDATDVSPDADASIAEML